MKDFVLYLFLLNLIIIASEENKESKKELISDEEYVKILNTGERVIAQSDFHLKMYEVSMRAMRITAEINNKYNTPQEIRRLMSTLIKQELDEGFGLFPPFFTDCGINIHFEKNVFIK